MTLTEGSPITYGEHEVGKFEMSIEFRTKELKQKLVSKTITDEEKTELSLLVS